MLRSCHLAAIVALAVAADGCGNAPTTPSCSYTVTPSAITVAAQAGATSVSVATGSSCSWTAVSNATWLAILVTPFGRSGDGIVQIVAAPNSGLARNGTLTIAGQVVTVSQAGAITARLSGRVKEAWIDSGLAGVTVAVVSGPSAGSTTTGPDGTYILDNLTTGTYRISYSKPFYTADVQTIAIAADTTVSTALNAAIIFPFTTANLSGGWAGGGPYPNEPMRLTLIQNGSSLTGYYIDRHDYSETVTGSYIGATLLLRIPAADGVITFEGTVDDERHAHGFLKNERLGGNFPVSIVR